MYRFRDTLPINISEQTISGDLVTIENPEEMGVVDSLEVSLSPIQDFNGYDAPWVGGAGKNKLPKGTSSTSSGITFSVQDDGRVKVTGTATATAFWGVQFTIPAGTYVLNGCPSGGGGSSYLMDIRNGVGGTGITGIGGDTGNGTTFTIASALTAYLNIRIASGYSAPSSGLMLSPMLRLASETDVAYAPYSNICPISGRTEVVTHRTGKNLLPAIERTSASNGITAIVNTNDWTVTLNGSNPNGASWINIDHVSNASSSVFDVQGLVGVPLKAVWDDAPILTSGNMTFHVGVFRDSTWFNYGKCHRTSPTLSFTYNEGDMFGRNYLQIPQGNSFSNQTIQLPMICLASDSNKVEPYNGQTYTTALGRTVYGGTLDVVSGVLTVDKYYYEPLSSTAWETYDSATLIGRAFSSLGIPLPYVEREGPNVADITSSHFVKVTQNGAKTIGNGIAISKWSGNDFLYFSASKFGGNPDTFKSYLDAQRANGTPVQVVYELATPQTYQLTPQQIDLLLGTNHLWSDGEISVVWHKDLTKGRILPTEAVSINGQYIENVLDGYRTLYTKGRESLGAELNTYSVGTADGEKFKNKRYPARELTVGFQLIADNAEDFREKFNNLNNLLAIEEADFIFNDETDKFFSGYPIMNAEAEAGENSVKGEWKIYCAYPFKRSVEPITLTMEDATVTDTTATFTIDYKGSRPARPVLRAKFAGALSGGSSSEDGDCGFVAFMDGEENIIQLGNPEVLDLDEYTKAETLINKSFVNISDFTRTGGHTYKGTVTGSVSTSNTTDAYWNGGRGQTQSYAKPTYGSGTGLHGAILWKNTAGAVNFTMHMVHRLCVSSANQTGVFECGAYNHDTGVMVAGFVIDKSANGTTGTVRYIVNGTQVGSDNIDLSYYNNHFGYCNRTPVYVQQTYYDPVKQTYKVQVKTKKKKKKKKKYVTKSRIVWVARTRTVFSRWNYTQSNLNSSIEKEGSYVYIKVGNLPLRTFNVPDVEQMIAHDASVFMGTYGTAMHTNMIHSLLFRREAGVPFAEQPNVFTAGDIVEADCNEATVYIYRDGSIGGHLEPQYGALGNDWEDFMLTSGSNVIRATWSEWVNPTYKPQIEIEYNEVFI